MTRALARLYPRAFREYWGDEFTDAIRSRRDAPDLIREAVRLWAHPTLWPADGPVRRRGRARTTGLAVAVAVGWFSQLLSEFGGARFDVPALGLLFAGAVLLLPRPAIRRLHRLLPPAALATAIVVVANATPLDRHDQPVAGLITVAWWATLAWGGAMATRVLSDTVTPVGPRLTAGLAAVTGAAAVFAGSVLAARIDAVAAAVCLAGLAAIAALALTDLQANSA